MFELGVSVSVFSGFYETKRKRKETTCAGNSNRLICGQGQTYEENP
jgi:hypothetical protein